MRRGHVMGYGRVYVAYFSYYLISRAQASISMERGIWSMDGEEEGM